MNYSYQNQYGQVPYVNPYTNGYGVPQQMPYQPQQMQPQQMQPQQIQTQPTQQSYLPLTFVNGVEGAKAFIVNPNQVVFLKDSDSDILFEKKADAQGKYSLTAYKLTQIDMNNIGKPTTNVQPIKTENFVTKDEMKDFVTTKDLEAFRKIIEGNIGQLSSKIDKAFRNNSNTQKQKDSD